jgi:hypothetical protein
MLDFPSSPVEGQIYGGYLYSGGVWMQNGALLTPTAQARNRIVNPAMQISQENGNAAGTSVNGYFAADQFYNVAITAAAISIQRVQSVTPNGSKDRFRISTTSAGASVAANYVAAFSTAIEGIRIADFKWGTAQARQAILRCGFKAPAGTYSVSVQNGAQARSYVVNFAIAAGQANVDTEQVFIIPGDTTGTWSTDTSAGVRLFVAMVVGTDRQGVAGWQAGERTGTSTNTNGFVSSGNVFELWDVGLYADPQNTGVAPAWVAPDEAQELAACQRYFQWVAFQFYGNVTSGLAYLGLGKIAVPMRVTPTIGGGINLSNGGFPATVGAYAVFNVFGGGVSENRTANATIGGGLFQSVAVANARL